MTTDLIINGETRKGIEIATKLKPFLNMESEKESRLILMCSRLNYYGRRLNTIYTRYCDEKMSESEKTKIEKLENSFIIKSAELVNQLPVTNWGEKLELKINSDPRGYSIRLTCPSARINGFYNNMGGEDWGI